MPLPSPAAGRAEAENLALALVARDEADQLVGPGALERARTVWLRFPEHGDLLVLLVTAPD